MPIFVCRWPNGDLSIVAAKDKDDAICRLDELDNSETSLVFKVDNFLLDLKLADDGRLTTDDEHRLGEMCEGALMAQAYPILWEARQNLGDSMTEQGEDTAITEAVKQERDRMGRVPASVPIDPTLRALKEKTGMPDALLHRLGTPPGGTKRKP